MAPLGLGRCVLEERGRDPRACWPRSNFPGLQAGRIPSLHPFRVDVLPRDPGSSCHIDVGGVGQEQIPKTLPVDPPHTHPGPQHCLLRAAPHCPGVLPFQCTIPFFPATHLNTDRSQRAFGTQSWPGEGCRHCFFVSSVVAISGGVCGSERGEVDGMMTRSLTAA